MTVHGSAVDPPAWAVTLGLFVVAPRAALALVAAIAAARVARRLPVEIDAASRARHCMPGAGPPPPVEMTQSDLPTPGERLRAILQEEAGARAVIRDGARPSSYGDGPEAVNLGGAPAGGRGRGGGLAQTPERRRCTASSSGSCGSACEGAGWQLAGRAGDGETYGARVGSATRVREPRAPRGSGCCATSTWSRWSWRPGMTTVRLSLISHTNVGKTTLARALLRREIGEVRDPPHVTSITEAHPAGRETEGAAAPLGHAGFRRPARLMTRLRRERDP